MTSAAARSSRRARRRREERGRDRRGLERGAGVVAADGTDNGTVTEEYSSDKDGGTFEFIAGDPDNAVQGTFLRTLKVVPDRSQIEGYADVPSPQTRSAGWQPGGFDSDTFDDAMITIFDADAAFNGVFTIESQGFGGMVLRHDHGQDFGGGATRAETWTYTLQAQ